MPWDTNHKHQSRQRILEAAAQLFVARGFDGVGIDDVMQQANMTRGAFYSHFKSKSELYHEAIPVAGFIAKEQLEAGCSNSFNVLKHNYLNQHKGADDTQLCPIALLISDIRHRDPAIRETYEKVFAGFVEYINSHVNERSAALAQAATMIGAVALAQTLTDESLKAELLAACEAATRCEQD
ncbi:TetR/AcrR family transcriptional regulator [Pseudoalteromonas citrea]|uniref:TetR/AcrR family transcriptional regulator n=1 Tax=Pseudoalteromonas citrea TaxID=43655 RepID=A0A5S3XFU8_9GAMM|nr:TetR/AcrR family transcriptional regulator [Pseudoalteromonas citrea]TMP41199.1 TetR/AcrR family transcriptional regulator [Pseudoalteromonas citrea]TMP51585.1 TetR/AcrR family transcriptional regulator [Pseudoalteromonas citrea]